MSSCSPVRPPTPPSHRVWCPRVQYSAVDGVPDDWHLVHLGSFARGGAGLVLTEATAVSPEGRISPADTGIWNDEQRDAWARIVDFVHGQGAVAGHPARPRRAQGVDPAAPWRAAGLGRREDGGWGRRSPLAVAFPGLPEPRELTAAEIDEVVADFAAAARRARGRLRRGGDPRRARLPAARVLSPLSNRRNDDYGGSFDNRARLLLRVVRRGARPPYRPPTPLLVRISATDWADGGWTVDDSVELARRLREAGVDLVDVLLAAATRRRTSRSARLPGAVRRAGSARRRGSHRRRRPDHRAQAGRGDRRRGAPRTWCCSRGRCCATRTGRCGPRTSSASRSGPACTGPSSTSAQPSTEVVAASRSDMEAPVGGVRRPEAVARAERGKRASRSPGPKPVTPTLSAYIGSRGSSTWSRPTRCPSSCITTARARSRPSGRARMVAIAGAVQVHRVPETYRSDRARRLERRLPPRPATSPRGPGPPRGWSGDQGGPHRSPYRSGMRTSLRSAAAPRRWCLRGPGAGRSPPRPPRAPPRHRGTGRGEARR